MAEKKMIMRHFGGYEYVSCPECKTSIKTNQPIQTELPYCSSCNKAVLDINQNYCGWCGEKFDDANTENTYLVIYENRVVDEVQTFEVKAKNEFRAGRAFYRKYNRKFYYDCIKNIRKIK